MNVVDAMTPLHFAAIDGNPKITEILITHGANIRAQCESGRYPTDCTRTFGHYEALRLLEVT